MNGLGIADTLKEYGMEIDETKLSNTRERNKEKGGSRKMKQKESVPIPQKLLLTVEEAAAYSNIGVHRIRDLLEEPDCDFSLKKGAYSLIKRAKFEKYKIGRAHV